MAIVDKHTILEKNITLLSIFAFLVVTIGGIVQIAPLFWLQNTIGLALSGSSWVRLKLTLERHAVVERSAASYSPLTDPTPSGAAEA